MTLQEIQKAVDDLANKISAPLNLLPTFGYSNDFAFPHIEVDAFGMHYVIVERGQELERKTTENLDELLYWIFKNVTFKLSTDYELRNRIKNKDSRRLAFKKQEELLGMIKSSWKNTLVEEHNNILIRHPFDDLAGLRAEYIAQLRSKGIDEDEIDKLAYKKFPR